MFLRTIEKIHFTYKGNQFKKPKILYVLKCDNVDCGVEYEHGAKRKINSKSGMHFCSNHCKFASSKKGSKVQLEGEKTCLERYGTSWAAQNKSVTQKGINTRIEKYGSASMWGVPEQLEKYTATMIKNHGVKYTFQSKKLREKREETWLKNYGVPYRPFPQEKCRENLFLKMTKFPNKWSSVGEIKLSKILEEKYGTINRQKRVHKWPIDIHIEQFDIYVQFDGVYWHGLDRPIEKIKASKKPRDIGIYQKWMNDQEQNEWFKEHNVKLFRITDVQFELFGISPIISYIDSFLT